MNDDKKPNYLERADHQFVPNNVPVPAVKVELSADTRARIDKWLQRYPQDQKRSGVFEALRLAQIENGGSLDVAYMDAVADYLGLAKVAVYEVAAFYTMYFMKPVGKHIIDVCTNISCALNGAEKIANHFKERLQIDFNETTKDGKFTLKEVECLGACVAPPVCMIGKRYYENLTPSKIDEILQQLQLET